METVSLAEFEKNLTTVLDRIEADCEPVIISRSGHPPAVLLSLSDYQSMEGTAHLLRSPKNEERLMKSLADARSGKAEERPLAEEE